MLSADAVVLAVGNAAPAHRVSAGQDVRGSSAYIRDPWLEGSLAGTAVETTSAPEIRALALHLTLAPR